MTSLVAAEGAVAASDGGSDDGGAASSVEGRGGEGGGGGMSWIGAPAMIVVETISSMEFDASFGSSAPDDDAAA